MTPIIFTSGFNVIYGNVEDLALQKKGKKNEHNLGKTSLVHLIDFLLLKKATKKHFLVKHKAKFTGWVFYIEIELNDGSYLTVRRAVDTPSLVSFKTHAKANQDFSETDEWDQKSTRLTAKKEKDSATILEEYLGFDVLENYPARHFLTYLLRTQYDYESVFKMRQFEGLDVDWKPQLFELLGYENEQVSQKYRLQYEIKNYQTLLKIILGNKKSNTSDSYNLKAAIAEKEREKKEILAQINKFDFYLREKKINKDLVEEIEKKISKLNSERYRLDYEIGKIRESLNTQIVFNIEEIKEVFEQSKIFFPDQLKKNYEELVAFNESLSNERSKYLKEDLKTNLALIEKLNDDLKGLNQEKESMLSFLRDTDTFSKYKSYQDEVFRLDEQISQFKIKLESLGTAEGYENKIDILKAQAKETSEKIKNVIDKGNSVFDEINTTFKNIFKNVMEHTALLIVKPNAEGNPEFEVITLDDKDEDQITGQGDGYTATKVQCAAFVLAFLIAYQRKSFFRFAYHDGLMESWGDIPKMNFLNQIRTITKENNVQYIISVIKSDIPEDFEFEDGEVVATLSHENPLFGFTF